jgi:hypothetical protein
VPAPVERTQSLARGGALAAVDFNSALHRNCKTGKRWTLCCTANRVHAIHQDRGNCKYSNSMEGSGLPLAGGFLLPVPWHTCPLWHIQKTEKEDAIYFQFSCNGPFSLAGRSMPMGLIRQAGDDR